MTGFTIGVDVGGTKILGAVVDGQDQVVARAKASTPIGSSDELMQVVQQVIRRAAKKVDLPLEEVDAIGIGVPGVVGDDGTCIWAPNAPLSGVPVAGLLHEEFGLPVAVGNDVNVGTLGEKVFGAAREFDHVFGMFVGTGIGGGLVIDGKVIVGDHALGAEVGHIIVNAEAARAGEPGGGEFEYYASKLGIERRLRAAIEAQRETCLKAAFEAGEGEERLKSSLLRDALRAGDAVTCEVMAYTAEMLGLGCVTVIHLCDPEAIVFGGGVIEACGDWLMPRIEATIRRHVAPGNGKPLRFLVSALGDDAVLLGAAALARGLAVADGHAYPRIEAPDFGSATVNGQQVEYDIVVRASGSVKRRNKKLSRKVHGTSHEVSEGEIKKVCRGKPERLYIGNGHHGHLQLSREASEWLADAGIEVTMMTTAEAARAFNSATGKRALLLHVTC